MASRSPITVLCNGASPPTGHGEETRLLQLSYFDTSKSVANINLGLPNFVRDVYHLPDRVLDLLELAAYVYCADRLVNRGDKAAVEYHGWARSWDFVVKVRDIDFWQDLEVTESLASALEFMTGDRHYRFAFVSGHSSAKTNLFDHAEFDATPSRGISLALFSGGLDSLAGVLGELDSTERALYLVSHQSQASTVKTQNQLVKTLQELYRDRVFHYKFECKLRGVRAAEETQRTRAFLYTCIAYAVAHAFGQKSFTIYENGITSLNLPRREDLFAARASRTTHPQTISRLSTLFRHVEKGEFDIESPFLWLTKTDVLDRLGHSSHRYLLPSTVSCSKTFKNLGLCTHCGGCSQCIDRRIAAYASSTEDIDDAGLYDLDIVAGEIADREVKTTAVDYIRQAKHFLEWNDDHFFLQFSSEMAELVEYLPNGKSMEFESLGRIRDLCRRHGAQVEAALRRMRDLHDHPFEVISEGSLLALVANREYFAEPVQRLVERISAIMKKHIALMFSNDRPANEADLNRKIAALLESHETNLKREHPVVSFASARAVPDHGDSESAVWIEAKYVRGNTTPSKATEGMAADLFKYPPDKHILFVVYDPDRSIIDDEEFGHAFESRRACTVLIVR